ncbi:uncharacterized protein KZ484_025198 isoform 2-T2 [Pholidichthys leucotaenia]
MKKKATKKRAKREKTRHRHDVSKTEAELLSNDANAEEGFIKVNTIGQGLNVQIKEEPQPQEICDYTDAGTGCLHAQGQIKGESDHLTEYDFSEAAAVKQEPEPWVKEEQQEEEEASNIQADLEEGAEVCTDGSVVGKLLLHSLWAFCTACHGCHQPVTIVSTASQTISGYRA